MLDDIKEEPAVIKKLAEKYLPAGMPVQNIFFKPGKISKIYIVASGSSRNAGNIARYFIETAAQIPVSVEHAGEFAERNPVLSSADLVIFVSQSGETSDVLDALKTAKTKGVYTFAITNNENSSIHKTVDSAMFIHAGTEKSIPATKSFTAQLICLYISGICLAENNKTLSEPMTEFYKEEIRQMPERIKKIISDTEKQDKIAAELCECKSLIVLGRGQNFGLAEEFALKIQETCYINAVGYPTGEFLHGHLAMLDENFPVVSVITKDENNNSDYMHAIDNTIQIIKKRNPPVFTVNDKADDFIKSKFSEFNVEHINIPELREYFSPVYSAVILHLLSFKIAKLLGHDVNNPRSLSKIVTDEGNHRNL